MNVDNVVVTTDEGYAAVFDFGDARWGFAIYRHSQSAQLFDPGDIVTKGFADTEATARQCAAFLAHQHICPDCRAERIDTSRHPTAEPS